MRITGYAVNPDGSIRLRLDVGPNGSKAITDKADEYTIEYRSYPKASVDRSELDSLANQVEVVKGELESAESDLAKLADEYETALEASQSVDEVEARLIQAEARKRTLERRLNVAERLRDKATTGYRMKVNDENNRRERAKKAQVRERFDEVNAEIAKVLEPMLPELIALVDSVNW